MMSVEISVCLNAAEGSPRPLLYPLRLTRSGGEPGWCLLVSGAVGGDVRVPRLAGADDRVQLARRAAASTVCACVGMSLLFSRVFEASGAPADPDDVRSLTDQYTSSRRPVRQASDIQH
jgi:hypothetical protein